MRSRGVTRLGRRTKHLERRAQGGSLASAIGALLLACASNDLVAQESPLENIIVTGSRISRADFESPSPIVTVPEAAFEQTGTTSPERVLNLYPQFVPDAGATSNSPARDGQANVSLRGLGSNRTLVLVDGRRLIPADGQGNVDLNLLPNSLIRSVQVLTGGASTAYGSDAVAGVVNFELVDTFDGVALEGSWSTTDHGDGDERAIGLTAGTKWGAGRGSVVAYVGYVEREAIMQSDRAFSRIPLWYVRGETNARGPGGAFLPSGAGLSGDGIHIVFSNPEIFDEVFAKYGFAPRTAPWQPGLGVNADGTLFTIGNGEPGSVVNYRGVRDPVTYNDRSYSPENPAPYTALQMPLERLSGWLKGRYLLTDNVEVYAQALYGGYSTERKLGPAPIGIVLIPPTNPFMPPDLATLLASRAAPDAPYRYFRGANEVGPQTATNDRDVLQITAGMRTQFASDWKLDVYAQVGENDRTERQANNVSLSRMQDLTFAADGGLSICDGGFDPYHAGSLSAACAQYVATDASSKITLRQTVAEATVDGTLASLPAGALQLAVGVFYKRDQFDYDADATLSAMLPAVPEIPLGPRPDVSGFPAAPDRSGSESNVDGYLELHAPLLTNGAGARTLEAGLGYRYSDYSQAGGVSSYKADLAWTPMQALRVRGSYQHAVRAPSIEDLYYPQLRDQFVIPRPDPCSYDSSARTGPDATQVEALCLAQGLSPALLAGYRYDLQRVDGVSGGNPKLEPEQADTYSIGFVVTKPASRDAFRELQFSLDWYQIEIEQGIGRFDSELAVQRCFDPAYNPTYSDTNIYCSFFSRDSATGTIFAEIIDRNIGGLETAGIDVQLDWGFDAGPGNVGVHAFGTYVDHWTYFDPSGGEIEYAGTVGGAGLGRSAPRWKSLVDVSYGVGPGSLLLRWQHLNSMNDDVWRDFEVPARDYVDLGASYAFEDGTLHGLSVHAGVDNVFDEQPAIFPSSQQANTDPSIYDVLGRRYYVRLKYAFH